MKDFSEYIAILVLLSPIILIIGLIEPLLILHWNQDPTRKNVLFVFCYYLILALVVYSLFEPTLKIHSRFFLLCLLSFIVIVLGLIFPEFVTPWVKETSRWKALEFTLPPFILFFYGYKKTSPPEDIDPRYALSKEAYELANDKQKIQYLVAKERRGTDNYFRSRIKEIRVSDLPGGGYKVEVLINLGHCNFNKITKIIARDDIAKIYSTLYNNNYDIREADITAYRLQRDKNSHSTDEITWSTSLNKEQIEEIKWNSVKHDLNYQVIPKLWMTKYIDPKFK